MAMAQVLELTSNQLMASSTMQWVINMALGSHSEPLSSLCFSAWVIALVLLELCMGLQILASILTLIWHS